MTGGNRHSMRRALHALLSAMLAALLVACTAPSAQTGADAPPAPAAAPVTGQPEAAAQVADQQRPTLPAKPPRMSTPLPPKRVGDRPVVIDRSCQTDADCAVKDVGNCCGHYPACVNKDSPTDPAGVRAQCAASGMASVCGFAEISACTCSAGKCEAAGGSGAPVAQ